MGRKRTINRFLLEKALINEKAKGNVPLKFSIHDLVDKARTINQDVDFMVLLTIKYWANESNNPTKDVSNNRIRKDDNKR
jgi:hypothetical protein